MPATATESFVGFSRFFAQAVRGFQQRLENSFTMRPKSALQPFVARCALQSIDTLLGPMAPKNLALKVPGARCVLQKLTGP